MSLNLYYTKYFTADVLQSIIAAEFVQKSLSTVQVNKKFDPVNLQTEQGILNQPNSILRFICAGTKLEGTSKKEQIQINQWFEYFNIELHPLLKEVKEQVKGQKEKNKTKINYCIEELKKALDVLNSHLKLRTFFVGDSITTIDISFASQFQDLFRKKYPNVFRWFNFVRSTGPFQKIYGRTILCGKNALDLFADEKEQKQAPKSSHKKVVKSDQEEDKTPAGGFKIDDFKRTFQNSQNREEVINHLLDNFDDAHWSLWKIHYQKDVTEGKVDFTTMNLASGNLQRLDELRKTGFGTWGVYGQPGNYEIRGVMFWKGAQISQVWKDQPNYSFHTFTKLDHKSVEDRTIIHDYWLHKKSAEGLTLYDSKRLI